jgi:DNA polymerase-3 subunit beta
LEFTIEREVFLRGIQKTLGIVDRKSAMPILGNILIAAAGEELTIVATDREICLTMGYRASVIKEGGITIPARKLFEAVRELQGETLHLVEAAGSVAVLTSNRAVCKLRGLSADDFPQDADPDDLSSFKIKAVLLRELIGKVAFAICTDEMRTNLGGVFLEKEFGEGGDVIRMVATDGHRMAVVKTDITDEENRLGHDIIFPPVVIIPRKGIQEIRKLLDGEEGDVSIGFRKGACVVTNDKNTRLSVSLIDGEFPDYRRVIPGKSDDDTVIRIDKAAILHGLRRMGVIEPGRVDLTISGNLLVLNSIHPDVGEMRDEIEMEHQGEGKAAAFNGEYLRDAIEAVSGGMIELRLPAGRDMGVIRDAGNENHFCIVMGLKN